MLNSQSVLRNDVNSYCLARWVWDLFRVEFVFFFIVLAPDCHSECMWVVVEYNTKHYVFITLQTYEITIRETVLADSVMDPCLTWEVAPLHITCPSVFFHTRYRSSMGMISCRPRKRAPPPPHPQPHSYLSLCVLPHPIQKLNGNDLLQTSEESLHEKTQAALVVDHELGMV